MASHCSEYESVFAALIERTLDEPGAARLRLHMETCAACREEYQWLVEICGDLEAVGRNRSDKAPRVDLVQAVAAAVARKKRSWERVRLVCWPKPMLRLAAGGFAVAAALVLGLWWMWSVEHLRPAERLLPFPTISRQDAQPVRPGAAEWKPAATEDMKPTLAKLEEAKRLLPKRGDEAAPETGAIKATPPPDLGAVTVQDVMALRKEGGTNVSARARFEQLASLAPQKARELAQAEDVAPEVVVGAGQSLPPEESQLLLVTAVGHYPDDPYLRFAAVNAFDAQELSSPETEEAAYVQLTALHDLDPTNALAYYLEAKLHLDQGELEMALSALETARLMETASAYALEAAAYREAALTQAGFDPDVAHILAALSAGTSEYGFLCDLGGDLLQYGQYYAERGELQIAQQIVGAVQQLGSQLNAAALSSQERLAGLDIQRAAIDVLAEVYTALGSGSGIEFLVAQTRDLVDGFDELRGFLEAFERLLFGSSEEDLWRFISDVILQEGDLAVLDYLKP